MLKQKNVINKHLYKVIVPKSSEEESISDEESINSNSNSNSVEESINSSDNNSSSSSSSSSSSMKKSSHSSDLWQPTDKDEWQPTDKYEKSILAERIAKKKSQKTAPQPQPPKPPVRPPLPPLRPPLPLPQVQLNLCNLNNPVQCSDLINITPCPKQKLNECMKHMSDMSFRNNTDQSFPYSCNTVCISGIVSISCIQISEI